MCTKKECKVDNSEYKRKLNEQLKAVEASQKRLYDIVKMYNKGSLKRPIQRADLVAFPLGIWVDINDKIRAKKRKNRFYSFLNFIVEMEKGAELGVHFHSDLLESAEVLEGEVIDIMDDNKPYEVGDVAEWKKKEKHQLVSVQKTKLHVLFKA